MNHIETAKKSLQAAIARHQRHMDGTEATTEASQKKLMNEMMAAMSALEDIPKAEMSGPVRFRAGEH